MGWVAEKNNQLPTHGSQWGGRKNVSRKSFYEAKILTNATLRPGLKRPEFVYLEIFVLPGIFC